MVDAGNYDIDTCDDRLEDLAQYLALLLRQNAELVEVIQAWERVPAHLKKTVAQFMQGVAAADKSP